jgi:hypothetical protein
VTVDRLQRVENGGQHEQFSVHKSGLRKRVGEAAWDQAQMVRLLFHGTSEDAGRHIINEGFQPLLAGKVTLIVDE